jgi:hypothetical protein
MTMGLYGKTTHDMREIREKEEELSIKVHAWVTIYPSK